MSTRAATRGYALTPWSRAWVDVVEGHSDSADQMESGAADTRRITKARRYFRDHHAERLQIAPGSVTASVRGSQLDPFDVTLTMRTVDTATVVTLLRAADATGDLMALTRGEQPRTLGELVSPTESADIAADCTCPDESPRCIHVLCVAYEVAAEIDRHATTLLTVMGTDLAALLRALETPRSNGDEPSRRSSGDESSRRSSSDERSEERIETALPTVDFYGTHAALPPLPRPTRTNPLMDLDADALRSALRASGVAPADIGEAMDALGELYDRLLSDP